MDLSNITVIDFETSGLNPERDRVIEIAAIRCSGNEIVSTFSTLIQFDGTLSPKITQLTGLTGDDLTDGMDETTAFRILNRFIGTNTIVAHNAAFDLGFLHHTLMRLAGRSFRNDFVDTLTISRARHLYPHTLKDMCDKFGIVLEGNHRALNDVVACWELLKKLNEDEPVDDYVNMLGYIRKFGVPAWYPNHAHVEAVEVKYA